MSFIKITEQPSLHEDLEQLSVRSLLEGINEEDQKVALTVRSCIPHIERLVTGIVERMQQGGRVFYIGAGTSGRLGVLDASEIPPTFGMPDTYIIGIIAGGETALRHPVENAEDDTLKGWEELQAFHISDKDTVIGIAASGTTPYVIGALQQARKRGILTAGISSNPDSPLSHAVDIPIEMIVGPEFVTGSSRMKSGTGQKNDSQHDQHFRDDKTGKGEGKPNGQYATKQPKTGRPGNENDYGGTAARRKKG